MEIRNCARCGKIFQSMGRKICPDCVQAEEEDFRKVREYLRTHKNTNIAAVSEATGVAAERINQFVREGRLEFEGVVVECMSCGTPIKKGRFCHKCLAKMRGVSVSDFLDNESNGAQRNMGTVSRFYAMEKYFNKRD